jgi:CelD/BcsL family acetyltransferase involved in cellulose biosynthesis
MKLYTQFTDELQRIWNECYAQETKPWPFLTFAWHQHWHKCNADGEPYIFVNEDQSVLLPLSRRDSTVYLSGGEEIADYLDAVGRNDKKADAWNATLPRLLEHNVTDLLLRNIPAASSTAMFFRDKTRAVVTPEDTTPTLTLTDSFESYLAALERKKRHEIKRKLRKFDEQYPGAILRHVRGTVVDMNKLADLMRLDRQKEMFLTPPMQEFFSHLPTLVGNNLVFFTLDYLDKTVASVLSFHIGEDLLLYNSGFNPDLAGSGMYLKIKIIEWATQNGIKRVNFLQGNERYKYDLGATDDFVYRIQMHLR